MFGTKFPRVRPDWLRGPSGTRLELDGFSEQLSLAFEHQGTQHYKKLRHFHRHPGKFERQQVHDEIKRKVCLERGVSLIEVPEVPSKVSLRKLAQYILTKTLTIPTVMSPVFVDYFSVYSRFPTFHFLV